MQFLSEILQEFDPALFTFKQNNFSNNIFAYVE